MRKNTRCLHKGRDLSDSGCADLVMGLDAAALAKCRTDCPRGAALAKSAGGWRGAMPASSSAIAETEQLLAAPVLTAWQMVAERTKCDTQAKLAKKLGTYQSKVSQFFVKLSKGSLPKGREWDRLLEITGYMPEELLLAANPKAQKPQTPEASSPDAVSLHGTRVAIAAEAQEDASETLPPLSKHLLDKADRAAMDGVPTLMGADPAEQLMGADDLAELKSALLSPEEWQDVADAIPADFELYVPSAVQLKRPALSINRGNEACITVDAVREYGLEQAQYVHVLFNRLTRQLGFRPTGERDNAALKLQVSYKSAARYVSLRGLWRHLGFKPALGSYPLAKGPAGLIVATIDAPAQPGGEA
jgi:hypothetical protein